MKLWKVGKVKKVYKMSHQKLQFEFTDQISVFDKIILQILDLKKYGISALKISGGVFYEFSKF
ncbi:MAG: phosphoribosylaminoimidazolesuccinocarboxamide synthase [Candidatus Methanofastidiosia archaeon]|jgi:phosphoribosylaminoimidazole-succinocarboxamide synthase